MSDIVSNSGPVCGVYFLFRGGALIYIGRSRDMVRRVASHRTNGREFDKWSFMPLPEDETATIEAALIRSLNPEQNTMHRHRVAAQLPPPEPETPSAPSYREQCFADAERIGAISKSMAPAYVSHHVRFAAEKFKRALSNGEIALQSSPGRRAQYVLMDSLQAWINAERVSRGLPPKWEENGL